MFCSAISYGLELKKGLKNNKVTLATNQDLFTSCPSPLGLSNFLYPRVPQNAPGSAPDPRHQLHHEHDTSCNPFLPTLPLSSRSFPAVLFSQAQTVLSFLSEIQALKAVEHWHMSAVTPGLHSGVPRPLTKPHRFPTTAC